MSEEEQAGLIGQAVLEHQAAVQEFACVRIKMGQFADALQRVGAVLEALSKGELKNDPSLEAYPSAEAVRDVLADYRAAYRRMSESRDALRALGLSGVEFKS